MAGEGTPRPLRGMLRTALAWAAGWLGLGVAAVATFAALSAFGIISAEVSWREALSLPIKFGIVGGAAGLVFSAFTRFLYRGRRLSDLSWVRFGIGGGIVTGVFVPLFLQTMNLLSGDGLVPWDLVLDDGLWTAAFGSVVAGGSLRLAQLSERALSGGPRRRVTSDLDKSGDVDLDCVNRPPPGGRGSSRR